MDDSYQAIDDIWPILAHTDWQDLQDAATEFVGDYREPKRAVELLYSEAKSTLHRVNPDMLLMTYKGASLLSRWWGHKDRPPWHVLPLNPPPGPCEEAFTLMETMPGACLKSIGLCYRNYKGQGPS